MKQVTEDFNYYYQLRKIESFQNYKRFYKLFFLKVSCTSFHAVYLK